MLKGERPCFLECGLGNMNDNEERLLDFCATHYLVTTETILFSAEDIYRGTWKYPSVHEARESRYTRQFQCYRGKGPCCLEYELGNMNDNEERLLAFCATHDLIITEIMFSVKDIHRGTRKRPFRHSHAPDHIPQGIRSNSIKTLYT